MFEGAIGEGGAPRFVSFGIGGEEVVEDVGDGFGIQIGVVPGATMMIELDRMTVE